MGSEWKRGVTRDCIFRTHSNVNILLLIAALRQNKRCSLGVRKLLEKVASGLKCSCVCVRGAQQLELIIIKKEKKHEPADWLRLRESIKLFVVLYGTCTLAHSLTQKMANGQIAGQLLSVPSQGRSHTRPRDLLARLIEHSMRRRSLGWSCYATL